jgi:nephrocystin-4
MSAYGSGQPCTQAEAFPALAPILPLLPEDFLVSYADVVPGVRRFNNDGHFSITAKQCISTLAKPILSPVYR